MAIKFKQYLLQEAEKKVNGFIQLCEKSKMVDSLMLNTEDMKAIKVFLANTRDKDSKYFVISGNMQGAGEWLFLYKILPDLSKKEIITNFKKMASAYSVGTGTDDLTKIKIIDL